MEHNQVFVDERAFLKAKPSLIGFVGTAFALGGFSTDFKVSALATLSLLSLYFGSLVAREKQETAYLFLGLGGLGLLGAANWFSHLGFLERSVAWQFTGSILWLFLWLFASHLSMKAGSILDKRLGLDGESVFPQLSTLLLMFLCYIAAFIQLGLILEPAFNWLGARLHLPA